MTKKTESPANKAEETLEDSPLLTHLDALRTVLLHCLVAVVLAYPIAFLATPYAIHALIVYVCPENMRVLHFFTPMEVLFAKLKLALVFALALSYPYNVFRIWKFVAPALYRTEQIVFRLWIGASSALFLLGAAFCTVAILPLIMSFAQESATPELRPILGLGNFLSLAAWLALAFGLMFQTPLAVLLAVRFGVVSPDALSRARPYVIVGLLVLAALLTPPDVISQLMLFFPTWLLFEGGLFLARRLYRKA